MWYRKIDVRRLERFAKEREQARRGDDEGERGETMAEEIAKVSPAASLQSASFRSSLPTEQVLREIIRLEVARQLEEALGTLLDQGYFMKDDKHPQADQEPPSTPS